MRKKIMGTATGSKNQPIYRDLLNMQDNKNAPLEDVDAELLVEKIKCEIENELDSSANNGIHYNQVAVHTAFRTYYQLLSKHKWRDQHYYQYVSLDYGEANILNERDIVLQYFVLLTSKSDDIDSRHLRDKCMTNLAKAVDNNEAFVLTILKTINLLFKKWPHLNEGNDLSLEHIYFCLQSNQMGMRDEMMLLLKHICTCHETAFSYFAHIVHFWPWTNRSKLYLMGCILKKHKLSELLKVSGFCPKDFFDGLRSTLNFKNLLAPSQYVIQALSSQSCPCLLQICLDILSHGSLEEIRNFNAHWFSRIQSIEDLFQLVLTSSLIDDILNNKCIQKMPPAQSYRMVLAFSRFSREVLHLSQENFTAFCANITKHCFERDIETQLLIFKLIVDNLPYIGVDKAMNFFITFLEKHMLVEDARFRNTLLGKMPTIINHMAKVYCKCCVKSFSHPEIEHKILNFFKHLHKDIDDGICSHVYQPKIFGLKLLEILIKSLYGKSVHKNAKSCSIVENQQLGKLLITNKVFDGQVVCATLMRILNDPSGFDDALHLTVCLIGLIEPDVGIVQDAFQMTAQCCALSDVDESNLSSLYARVVVENCKESEKVLIFFQETFQDIQRKLKMFEHDPLNACKSHGCHLYSSLNVLNELAQGTQKICFNVMEDMLLSIEKIVTGTLKMMNMCHHINDSCEVNAASFEDMDKSLEILVSRSEFTSVDHESSRKYLLMSFWLTLKACCDLSATMGEILATSREMTDVRVLFLQRCIQVSVAVLTKCRHKGAIETAGTTIGKLTKIITSRFSVCSEEYDLLQKCVQKLCNAGSSDVSTTRRGAGFAIMFLHIVKNECPRSRPILNEAIKNLLKPTESTDRSTTNTNCDRIEALHLHYLCVLVRDTELKDAVCRYYNEIMMAAILQIDNPEWTICNAALQLFGALVPKIVGQRQATEFCELLPWEPSEVTFCELTRKLKLPFNYILKYCLSGKCSTRSIILFLEFFHKVEYIHKSSQPEGLTEFRELIWCLLHHHCEKVRILAAKCFVRSHEFSSELAKALENIAGILFSVHNENFFEGLILTLHEGILKLQHDSLFVISPEVRDGHLQCIECILVQKFNIKRQHKLYSMCKLWDMVLLLPDSKKSPLLEKLRNTPLNKTDNKTVAIDLWLQRIHGH